MVDSTKPADVVGAVDMHCHTYPCLFPRLDDDIGVVRQARAAGLRAIVLKSHHEGTVSRARLAEQVVPDIRVFGGVVLNSYVGGINPAAAEAALKLGARQIWMPTIDAAHHRRTVGQGDEGGLTVLTPAGQLTTETVRILELIAAYGAILGTAHLSPHEIEKLVPEAFRRGVRHVLVTHPFFTVPKLDLASLHDLTRLGARAEFTYCSVSPMWRATTPERIAEAVRAVGADACLLSSDAGQRHNPYPAEALRIFAQQLLELGISPEEIDVMIRSNPARMLGLPTEDEFVAYP